MLINWGCLVRFGYFWVQDSVIAQLHCSLSKIESISLILRWNFSWFCITSWLDEPSFFECFHVRWAFVEKKKVKMWNYDHIVQHIFWNFFIPLKVKLRELLISANTLWTAPHDCSCKPKQKIKLNLRQLAKFHWQNSITHIF